MNLNEIVCKDGGILKELYKREDLGQINIRSIPPKTTVGGHKHLFKDETWLIFGDCEIRLQYDSGVKFKFHSNKNSPLFLDVPRDTGHEIENLDDEETVMIFWANKLYDPSDKYDWQW